MLQGEAERALQREVQGRCRGRPGGAGGGKTLRAGDGRVRRGEVLQARNSLCKVPEEVRERPGVEGGEGDALGAWISLRGL